MKTTLLAVVVALAITGAASAESKATLENVHLCCKACVNGLTKAAAKSPDVAVNCDAQAGTVELSAKDAAALQKAVDAIVGAGFYGKSSDTSIQLKDTSGAKDEQVSSLKVSGVHLCCGKCVTAVDKAVSGVKGVKAHTAEKGAKSFTVTGDFNGKAVFAALQAAGMTGKAGK